MVRSLNSLLKTMRRPTRRHRIDVLGLPAALAAAAASDVAVVAVNPSAATEPGFAAAGPEFPAAVVIAAVGILAPNAADH